jgi:hypothetical protein
MDYNYNNLKDMASFYMDKDDTGYSSMTLLSPSRNSMDNNDMGDNMDYNNMDCNMDYNNMGYNNRNRNIFYNMDKVLGNTFESPD